MRRPSHFVASVVLAVAAPLATRAGDLPEPPPPADGQLVMWEKVVEFCKKLDEASDRVAIRELGRTTEGRPYLAVFVSDAETIRDLETYRRLQEKLAQPDPKEAPETVEETVRASKAVVLVTCTIHSSEVASTYMGMRLVRDLAAAQDAETKAVLDKTILILVPSANPDGVDIVADWYARSKGKPWEGSGLPRLYHKYAGHDTNRDWFMLNLKETQLLTRFLYSEWFPTLTYDVHQMGSRGARIFVPPFYDPVNPNLDPRLQQSIALIGAHMAAALAAEGKRGVLTRAMYDNWWNGGNRTTPQRHNMVGVLTESASARLATPIFLEKSELRGATRGFPDHRPAINFVDPWPGGWWRIGDIAEYQRICALSLLRLAASYKDTFQRQYDAMGRAAIARGGSEPPFAWVVSPAEQRDPVAAAELVRILAASGIAVHRARETFEVEGHKYGPDDWILPAAQPYRAHLKDMMERQEYPARFDAKGEAEPPYDVAGWTLPLQLGVKAVQADRPLRVATERIGRFEVPAGRATGEADCPERYIVPDGSAADYRLLNALLDAGVAVDMIAGEAEVGSKPAPRGAFTFEATPEARKAVEGVLKRQPTTVAGIQGGLQGKGYGATRQVRRPRIGLYQPWMPSMDEGWTRLVLEDFGFPYQTLHNDEIRAGDLRDKIDVLLIPSIEAKALREGFGRDETEPEYVGGLGQEGAEALRRFVRKGGWLVCLEDSCPYAIDVLDLPVVNVLKGVKRSEFYCPGSIVAVRYPAGQGVVGLGMPEEGSAYFDASLAFDLKPNTPGEVVARYAPSDVLQSGWLLGPEKIAGKAAVVELPVGQGTVVLFGFPPQHRGQSHATFRLLFNALIGAGLTPKP